MALDPKYIAATDLNQYFVDSTTGEALANGYINFWQDNSRASAKPVYEIVQGSGPTPGSYSYAALPNPLTLSATGTIVDSAGNQVALYYYPFDAFGNQQLYYIEVFNANNVLQFTREAWPYPINLVSTSGGSGSGTVNTGTINDLAYYATSGTAVSALPTAVNSVLATSNTGAPAWTQSLPTQVQVAVGSLNNGTNANSGTYWNGAGTWQKVSTISAWTLIQTLSLASTASPLTFTNAGIGQYNNIVIEFNNVVLSTATHTHMSLGLSTNAGVDYTAGSGNVSVTVAGSSPQVNSSTNGPVQIDAGSNGCVGGVATNMWLLLQNMPLNCVKPITGYIGQAPITGSQFDVNGLFTPMVQFNALEILVAAGGFTSGTVNIYGY